MEVWKDIKGYEGLYQVSSKGNVKSLNYMNKRYAKNLTPKINNKGYKWVDLRKANKSQCMLVHRLVAMTFINNPLKLPVVNHKDENPLNCDVDNLEWCTVGYNNKYSRERHPERFIKKEKPKRKYANHSNTHINQYALDGLFIKQWNNFAELKKELNYHGTSIKECCEGKRKTAYGYKWEFANKEQVPFLINTSRETR